MDFRLAGGLSLKKDHPHLPAEALPMRRWRLIQTSRDRIRPQTAFRRLGHGGTPIRPGRRNRSSPVSTAASLNLQPRKR